MNDDQALSIINSIFQNVFRKENKNSLEEIKEKYAYDINLPIEVQDTETNEITWTDIKESNNHYITQKNMETKDYKEGWMIEKKELQNMEDIFNIWNQINYKTTERVYNSENIAKSDTLYNCNDAYNSVNCRGCNKIIFSEGSGESEYLLACKRSGGCNFCIKVDDSGTCSNSYSVVCSSKISNSLFIQDCFNLHECIFCAHIANKRYCICNMQFEKEEYFIWKKKIIDWILEEKK